MSSFASQCLGFCFASFPAGLRVTEVQTTTSRGPFAVDEPEDLFSERVICFFSHVNIGSLHHLDNLIVDQGCYWLDQH